MEIKIVTDQIALSQVRTMAKEGFGDFVKAVLDISRKIMALGGELHADMEAILLEQGSSQDDLWGINIYLEKKGLPAQAGEEFIEFDSMINLRPSRGNRSRGVEDPTLREKITQVVRSLIV